jgi:hypothetical protein
MAANDERYIISRNELLKKRSTLQMVHQHSGDQVEVEAEKWAREVSQALVRLLSLCHNEHLWNRCA